MSEFLKTRPEEIAADTWLSDFILRFNAAQEAYEKYPTEQNKDRWDLMLEIKAAMVLDIHSILTQHKLTQQQRAAD
jgi:hypothetical protein